MTRFRLGEELVALQARLGYTVLFVTHSVYEATVLAHEIAVMAQRLGRVAARLDNPPPSPRIYLAMARAVQAALQRSAGRDGGGE